MPAPEVASTFHRRTPGLPGIDVVYTYTSVEDSPTAARPPHRGLPSTSLTVIVALDAPLLCSPTLEDWAARRGEAHDVCLGGFHTQPVYLQRPDVQEGVRVVVHPLAARRILGLPAAALTELTQDADTVLGREIRRLHSRVGSAAPEDRAALVEAALRTLADRHETATSPRREVVGAWHLLQRSAGRMRVAEVASQVGLTPRHLSSRAQSELRIGTKTLTDLMPLEVAHTDLVRQLRKANDPVSGDGRRPRPNLADLAHTHGYADHAHLDAAYRRFVGTSPSSWIAEEFRNIQAGGHRPARDSVA